MISSTCSIRWRPSPRPDPTFSFAAERSDGQGWLKAIAKRLALDGREHSGRLVRSGEAGLWCWDSLSRYVSVGNGRRYRGELAIRRNFAPQTCIRSIREDRHHDAVMRIGGEAPRRWAHSNRGSKNIVLYRVARPPRPRPARPIHRPATRGTPFPLPSNPPPAPPAQGPS